MERTTEVSGRGHAAGGGVVAGAVAGAVMLILLLIMAATKGGDIWIALKGASAPFVHDRAHQGGLDVPVVVLGLACHFAISIIWGVLFALIFFGLPKSLTVVAGAGWGIVVWLVMYYVVLPIAGLGEVARSQPIVGAVVGHVVFGLVVALAFLPFQRTRTTAAPSTRAPAIG